MNMKEKWENNTNDMPKGIKTSSLIISAKPTTVKRRLSKKLLLQEVRAI